MSAQAMMRTRGAMRARARVFAAGVLAATASVTSAAGAQVTPVAAPAPRLTLLVPDRVFLGTEDSTRSGWVVLVRGDRIAAVGPRAQVRAPSDASVIELRGTTLIPGMIP